MKAAIPYHVWTSEKSRRAHIAKRKREQRPPDFSRERFRYVPKPRPRALFTVLVRHRNGERVQWSVHEDPWGGRLCSNGQTITQNCEGLRRMLSQMSV